ncbi:glycosyltransferase family 1 protein [Rhizobium sp. CG5]|nr:glycosyltransferase family 1 protein [Rhizobium sp. CG5]
MKIAILGTVGVPGRYGGFETLAENLVRQHHTGRWDAGLTVYCSAEAYPDRAPRYLSADLRYSRFRANGIQSILYDAFTLLDCARRGHDAALLLGVSGAVVLPFIRLFSSMRVVTNVDGIEWRRDKWTGAARHFLRLSEWMAVRFSHQVVADNQGIADHLQEAYGVEAAVIAYGGDHALDSAGQVPDDDQAATLPPGYALALCRIEPENNIAMILEAFACAGKQLVFVGNWDNSEYGRTLRAQYSTQKNILLLDPIYEAAALYRVRAGAGLYVHGHSAGGTNPSLVEMMHFGVPILAFDCVYNRYTTENQAKYFRTAGDLAWIAGLPTEPPDIGARLREIAERAYTWNRIGKEYFTILGADAEFMEFGEVSHGEKSYIY